MICYLAVIFRENLYHAAYDTQEPFTVGSGKKDNLHIDGMEQEQIAFKSKKGVVSVISKSPYPFYNDHVEPDHFLVLDAKDSLAFMITSAVGMNSQTLKLPYECVLKFGRNDKNDVIMRVPFVSGHHFTLRNEAGQTYVEDHGSTNGLFLNGRRITKAKLKSGDTLSILYINIHLENGVLSFENIHNELEIHPITEDKALGGAAHQEDSGTGTIRYQRSPRIQEQLPTEPIVLAPAPSSGGKFEKRGGLFGSFISTGVMTAVNVATGGVASPALLAARAASLISPVTSIVTQTGGEKKRKKKSEDYEQQRLQKYGQYIEDQKVRIGTVADKQRAIITHENPSARECLTSLAHMERTLWERSANERDFLDVRLGMGYADLCVPVKSREDAGFRMEEDELRDLSERIIEETRIVDNVPARISLKQYQTIGVVGNRARMISEMHSLLVSLTYSHCFDNVRIVGIFDEEERVQWESLRWLPHVWDESRQFRFLAYDGQSAKQLLDMCKEILEDRQKADKGSYSRDAQPPLPHYVFVVGSRAYSEKSEIMPLLTSNNPMLGTTTFFLFDQLAVLPPACQFIVDLDNGPCGYVRNEVNNKFFFTFDPEVSLEEFDGYARQMSAIDLVGYATAADIPGGVTFLEGYGVKHVEELNVLERWKRSDPCKTLAAPIGVMSGGKHFSLDVFDADYSHGAHGVVAGTTGSGKSETLQSWVLSMAINYHPHDVNFVIVDYKGGGMANILEDLPHVVGKITNIGNNVERALISLNAENKRRQRLFADLTEKFKSQGIGVNHIKEYMKLYREGLVDEPLPRLIIVSDEFAELKKEKPEAMANMIQVARIGRSLGVHLVLATQKPSGVVDDQIRANSRFWLCMKVADAADSREMIGCPDAARITKAGRAYIKVNNSTVFEQFQSYWSGASYNPDASAQDDGENQVRLVQIGGGRLNPIPKVKKAQKSKMDELAAVREYLCRLTAENGIRKLAGPWLPELPERVSVAGLKVDGAFDGHNWQNKLPWLRVPIGIYDIPEQQLQGTQYIDFAAEGHYGIYGAPGTGKTTLLKTVLWSIAQYYSPKDVQMYICDCGGWSMNALADLPHVGGVALDCEEEKFAKLQQMLTDEMTQRKKKFLAAGVGSLTAYRQATGGGMPALIIAIDNIVPMFENYPDMEPLMISIASQGSTYGVYLIYTANSTTGVKYKVLQNIKGAIAFELTDKGDYAGIVGRLEGKVLPKIAGRAFFKNTPPVEFQAAMYLDGTDDQQLTAELKRKSAEMDAAWDGPRPDPIPVMPEELHFAQLYEHYHERERIPLGISYADVKTMTPDLFDRYCLLVTGPAGSGKSRYITGLMQEIRGKRAEDLLYVFDSKKGAQKSLQELATKYATDDDAQNITQMLTEIVEMLNVRKRAQKQQATMEGDAFSEREYIQSQPQILIVIDDLKEFVDAVDNENKNSMERICRMADGLGVLVMAAGRYTDMERYNEIESLTRAIVACQHAVGLTTSPAMFSFLRNDLGYKEKEAEAGAGNGYAYDDGHCVRIKLPQ